MSRYDVLDDRSGRVAARTTAWSDSSRRGQPPRRRRTGHAWFWRVFGWISVFITVVIVSASLVAYAEWRHLLGNIQRENVSGLLGKRPPKFNSAMNILLIGSDSRAGTNAAFGRGVQGARSDTMILMHISPRRDGATLISFPRDSMVSTLGCKQDGMGHSGQPASQQLEMLNTTFDSGGAPCTWQTVETLTGIHIDHFIEIDFNGFQSMVNAVGGVNVCLPEAIKDPASKLNLGTGVHHVDGSQALAFVRERHIGEGSDLQRIQRQQYFMAALAKQVTTSNTLGDPGRLLSLANAATHSLTTDSGLDVRTLLKIAESMRGLHAESVNMISVPVVPDPGNPNRVDWAQPQSDVLFNAIKYDNVVHISKTKTKTKTARATLAKPAPNPLNPSRVNVQVLNGTPTTGLAEQTATALQQRGFNLVGTGNADATTYTQNVIQYASPSDLAAVTTLEGELTKVTAQLVPSLQPGTVNLVLGSDFTSLAPVKPPSNLVQAYNGINGSADICKDASAFAGPVQPSDFAP